MDGDSIEMDAINIPEPCQTLVARLNKETLCRAFENANATYRFGVGCKSTNKYRLQVACLRNAYSFGASALFRTLVSALRTPSSDSITDENAKIILHDFLTSTLGGKDIWSLKYLVVSQLLNIDTRSNDEAKIMIARMTAALKQSIQQEPDALAETHGFTNS